MVCMVMGIVATLFSVAACDTQVLTIPGEHDPQGVTFETTRNASSEGQCNLQANSICPDTNGLSDPGLTKRILKAAPGRRAQPQFVPVPWTSPKNLGQCGTTGHTSAICMRRGIEHPILDLKSPVFRSKQTD